jgi:IS5 family transposase
MRFAGLALHDGVPDAKTIWPYREQLARARESKSAIRETAMDWPMSPKLLYAA